MQRKATKKTRGPNSDEKAFMAWVKIQPCCICHQTGPSIVDHMYGATFRHNKILIGHWALLPYCPHCDNVKTQGSHRAHKLFFDKTQSEIYCDFVNQSPIKPPVEVLEAIKDWNR